jgi:hypothetical protein
MEPDGSQQHPVKRMKSELDTFDGKDNRRELMILLQRLGTDRNRAKFLESLIPSSMCNFANYPMKVKGACAPVTAYFMLVGICNELRVPINVAAQKLDRIVSGREKMKVILG